MSYTKNTWKSGDIVTSAKLNNIEDGIAALESLQSNIDIPTPAIQDSGKVLGVNEQGAYALVAGSSSGGSPLVVNISVNSSGKASTYVMDKTYNEIASANGNAYALMSDPSGVITKLIIDWWGLVDGFYIVNCLDINNYLANPTFYAPNADGYPEAGF